MRLFHLGDLHIGKLLYSVPMIESDQPYWVEQFLKKVDEYDPQVIMIAGDVYDKRDPSREAVRLFDHVLTELRRRDKHVLIIAGNHDSDVRLSFAKHILSNEKIHIVGEVTKDIQCVTIEDAHGPVHFWLMPYLYPRIVADASVLNRDDINSYDQAVRELLAVQQINTSERNVILVHQNVLAHGVRPEHSDSETIIGGLGEIEADAFDDFDYVAMGHIHNAQHMGRETVRYAGCPMYYDFSEENRKKYVTMVDIGEKGNIEITPVEVPLMHKLKSFAGELKDILKMGESIQDKENYYFQAIVCDRHMPAGAQDQLRAVFGEHLINVKREILHQADQTYEGVTLEQQKEMSMEELFAEFYSSQNEGCFPDEGQEELITKILEQQSRNGSDYYEESKSVPEADTDELINYLLKCVKDEEVCR